MSYTKHNQWNPINRKRTRTQISILEQTSLPLEQHHTQIITQWSNVMHNLMKHNQAAGSYKYQAFER